MIQLNQKPLPDPLAKRLSLWLRQPEAAEYIEFLARLSAAATALAGNGLVSGAENDAKDSQDAVAKARDLQAAIKLLREHRVFDYKFRIEDLTHQTQTTIEPQPES